MAFQLVKHPDSCASADCGGKLAGFGVVSENRDRSKRDWLCSRSLALVRVNLTRGWDFVPNIRLDCVVFGSVPCSEIVFSSRRK